MKMLIGTAAFAAMMMMTHAEEAPAPATEPAPAPATEPAPAPAEGKKGGHGGMREEMIKKFDKDGDGKLNDEEKAAAKAARAAHEAEMIKKFDKDGDGKLNDEEKAAAKAARKKGGEGQKDAAPAP